MISEVVSEHTADVLGAPYPVILLASARRSADGAVTVPDLPGLVAVSGLTRLWKDERLSGDELRHLRRAAELTREDLGSGMGVPAEEVATYEQGPRAMTLGTEKYVRIHLFNALRRVGGPRTDEMLNYLDWIFDDWRPRLRDAATPVTIRLRHFPTGWQEVRER